MSLINLKTKKEPQYLSNNLSNTINKNVDSTKLEEKNISTNLSSSLLIGESENNENNLSKNCWTRFGTRLD